MIDTPTGNHIWAERYDRILEDVFAVQEEVTQAIVAAITPQIDSMEQFKANRRRPGNLTAYEIALRAWAHAQEGQDKTDRAVFDQAILEAKEALAIDPNSVLALHVLAWANGTALFLQSVADREHALQEAKWAIARAIELDSMDAYSYALRGLGALHFGQWDRFPEAVADARRAHDMNPNDPFVLRILATLEANACEFDRAIEHLHLLRRLNPRDPRVHIAHSLLAMASFGARQYAEGIGWASLALADRPHLAQAHLGRALCLVGAGEIDKAKASFAALQEVAPAEWVRIRLEGDPPYARPEDRTRYRTFLRITAGLEDPSLAESLR